MAIILGIDPGSRVTGFGVIETAGGRENPKHISHGVIRLGGEDTFPVRMKELGLSLRELLAKYRPDEVVIEQIFLGKNVDSAFKLGHARGVAMYESACFGAPIIEYSTRLVKKGIVGNGGASKEEVQTVLQRLLKIGAISQLDASDALALAAFHAFQRQINWTKPADSVKAKSL